MSTNEDRNSYIHQSFDFKRQEDSDLFVAYISNMSRTINNLEGIIRNMESRIARLEFLERCEKL
jgi:hypothetical protein